MAWRLLTTLLVLSFALTWAPAADASSDRDQRKGDKKRQTGEHQPAIRMAPPVFSPDDRNVISDYYRNRSSNLPHGLEKRGGKLPPGLYRQLKRNGTLPRGLQERIDPFPQALNHQLPPLATGYTRGLIGGSAIVINRRTRAIVDVIHNLLDSSGL